MVEFGCFLTVAELGEIEIITPQCLSCIFYDRATFTCPAFPHGIPSSIQLNKYDHRKLYPLQRGALHWLPYTDRKKHPMD
jgi:hypothetical protein